MIRSVLSTALAVVFGAAAYASEASWPRWGGPDGDFKVEGRELASSWPPVGPPLLWSRPLGAGYSAIVGDDRSLYTMDRDGGFDVVVALDATDGKRAWERRYEGATRDENQTQFGSGPNATPLLLPDRLVTLGYGGMLHCLKRSSGEVLWKHDLIADLGGEVLMFGYSSGEYLVLRLSEGVRTGRSDPPSGAGYDRSEVQGGRSSGFDGLLEGSDLAGAGVPVVWTGRTR